MFAGHAMTEYVFEGPKRASAALTWSFATQTFPTDASTPFSDAIDPAYQATIQAAFARWASVSGLSFTQVADSPSAAIRIGFAAFASDYVIGETVVQSVGGFLPNDTVVQLLDPTLDPLIQPSQGTWIYSGTDITLLQVATHEIGHALGLDHTTDPSTVMYPVATSLNQNLAPGDIEGINGLYPLYTVVAVDPLQVEGNGGTTAYHFTITRHNDPALATTIDYQVSGTTDSGLAGTVPAVASEFAGGAFPAGQLTFASAVSTITLAVAVAGNTVAQPDQAFTISLSDPNPSNTATVRGTTSAVILDDDSSGSINGTTVSIYRFFDTSDGTHFFTASEGERNAAIQTRPDLVYEGADLTAVADPGSDPASTAVYRFFDTLHGTHFYTANTAERDLVVNDRPDLIYEGVSFYEHTTPQSGDNAVYRFFDSTSGTHFLTSAAAERATILATRPDYIDEGVAFYAPAV